MSRTISPLSLAFMLLAGPILWFVHFVLFYAAAEFGCRANFNNLICFGRRALGRAAGVSQFEGDSKQGS